MHDQRRHGIHMMALPFSLPPSNNRAALTGEAIHPQPNQIAAENARIGDLIATARVIHASVGGPAVCGFYPAVQDAMTQAASFAAWATILAAIVAGIVYRPFR
jgi:hypothetical protein